MVLHLRCVGMTMRLSHNVANVSTSYIPLRANMLALVSQYIRFLIKGAGSDHQQRTLARSTAGSVRPPRHKGGSRHHGEW